MAFSELDISGVTEHDKLAAEIEGYYNQDISDKLLRAYAWDEAIRFYDGDQHIEYNVSLNRFQQLSISKNNDFIPRPTTNYILPNVKTVVSQLTKQKPQVNVRANSRDPRDISAAKLGDLILDVKHEQLREDEKMQEKAYWGVITGTVFKKIFWDETGNKIIKVPKPLQETTVAPNETVAKETPPPAQEYNEFPLGEVNTAVIPPFNIAIPFNTRSPLELEWIMEYSVQKVDWIKAHYSKTENGYTGKAGEVTEEKNLNTVLQIEYRLRALSGRRTGGGGSAGSTGSEQLKNSAILKEYYQKPNSDYPRGRMVVVANKKTLFDGDSPYYEEDFEDSWHPYVEWRFEIVPGRFWGKGLVDEQVSIQRRINSIDALIILNRRTMAIPQWLIPEGCGVPNGYINGRPGLNIPYRPVGALGAKPEKVRGDALTQQVYQERDQAVRDIKRIGMTQDVLEGVNPEGVKTAYQLEQLQENALSSYGSTFQRWEKSIEREETKKLLLIAKRYKEPRLDFNKKLKNLNKDITDIDIELFKGEDLRDNVGVRVEVGSSIPRSRAGENALLREVVNGKIIDVVGDAVNKKEFMDKMGLKGFEEQTTPDIQRAKWENSIIENGNMEDLLVDPNNPEKSILELDDTQTHVVIHSARLKNPNVTKEIKLRYIVHIEEHLKKEALGVMAQQGTPAMPAAQPEQAQSEILKSEGVRQ